MPRTNPTAAELANIRETIQSWVRPGQAVFTVVAHVSRSRMPRTVRLMVAVPREDGQLPEVVDISWYLTRLTDARWDEQNQGAKVPGCGFDAAYDAVDTLSRALGYTGDAALVQRAL